MSKFQNGDKAVVTNSGANTPRMNYMRVGREVVIKGTYPHDPDTYLVTGPDRWSPEIDVDGWVHQDSLRHSYQKVSKNEMDEVLKSLLEGVLL